MSEEVVMRDKDVQRQEERNWKIPGIIKSNRDVVTGENCHYNCGRKVEMKVRSERKRENKYWMGL